MSLVRFWNDVMSTGKVTVSPPARGDERDAGSLEELLAQSERSSREELPGTPPAFRVEVAVWATTVMYRACQLLAYRELPAEAVGERMGLDCPSGPAAAVAYSADVAFQALPDVYRIAHASSPDDPVTVALRQIAIRFPLSSVGIPGLEAVDIAAFESDPCLMRLYVDRIIAKRDVSRASHPRVRELLGAAAGGYPHLVPILSLLPATTTLSGDL